MKIASTLRWSALRLVFLGAVVALLVGHAFYFDFVNDDAFISFRYADNLVRHGELVYNVLPDGSAERVEGYTNFLWTMLMAGVMYLGFDPVPWSKWLGVLFAAGTLLVLARFSARTEGRPSAWDALPGLLLAGAPAYAAWSTGGLETQLFTFTATLGWTQYLLERQGQVGRVPWSGLWFALSAMTRPEGMLLFGLTGLHRLIELIVSRQWPTRTDWAWGFLFAGAFGPYYAWRWWYYGWPFPNTYYVKTGAKGFWRAGLRYWWSWVSIHHIWVLPLLAAVRRALPDRRERRLVTLVTLYTVVISVHVIRVGGDFMALHRFLVPIMPGLAVLAAFGVRAIVESLRAAGHSSLRLATGAVLATALLAAHVAQVDREAMKVGSDRGVDSIGWLKMFAEQTAAIGQWLGENAPPDASLATTAAGIIPYYSRLYTLDILALNDEWLAHNIEARGSRPGHTKSAPLSYILSKDIDYLIYHPTIAERRPRQGAGAKRTWQARGYEWQTVQVPGMEPPWWGFWKRREGKEGT